MKLRSGRVIGTVVRTRKRRTRRTTTPTAALQTAVARRVVRQEIRRNTELKTSYYDNTEVNLQPTALYFKHTLASEIQPGDLLNQRSGVQIMLKKVHLWLTVINNNDDVPGWLRFMVVKRKKPEYNDTALFQALNNTQDGQNYYSNLKFVNQPLNTTLYTPILDKKIRVLAKTPESNGRNVHLKKYKLRFNKKIKYESIVEDNFNIQPNYHILAFIQWDDGNTERAMTVGIDVRTYYTDL